MYAAVPMIAPAMVGECRGFGDVNFGSSRPPDDDRLS